MSIKRLKDGDTMYCNGCYLIIKDGKVVLDYIEDSLFDDISGSNVIIFDDNYYYQTLNLLCPHCHAAGEVCESKTDEFYTTCDCHDTPHKDTPGKAWIEFVKYVNKEIVLLEKE